MATMRAVWLQDRTPTLRNDVAVPSPPEGEALVRVTRAGICNTDLELIRGYYPYDGILGHEFVGRVESGPAELRGRRVVGEINAACGACAACVAGRARHCTRRTVLGIVNRHGAFADYLTLPVENLRVVPDTVTDDQAVFVEPLAAALEIQAQVAIGAGDKVLIVGDGKLGQLIAQTLATSGCDLTVVGRHSSKLDLLSARGIRVAFAESVDPGAFDVAVECTGNADGFALAQRAIRARGTLVMKSTYAGPLTIDAAQLVVDELTLVGSRCGPFAPAIELLTTGTVDVDPLIAARYPLDDPLTAIEHAGRRGVLKVLLEVV
jgi:threonine dehydrogenase-like Zn-dependent dehydrogenase